MERDSENCGTAPRRRARRGAALFFALAAVLIISVLVLGMGRVVVAQLQLAETTRGYARAIYIAESAANWQLNRMSRSLPSDNTTLIPGRLLHSEVSAYNRTNPYDSDAITPGYALPPSEIGVNIPGRAQVVITAIDGISDWQFGDFNLYASGFDLATGVTRTVYFRGTGTGLADRYVLFAQNELLFNNDPSDPLARSGVTALQSGYIGGNNIIRFIGSPPTARTPADGGQFGGCRLGPRASLATGSWTAGWDAPRLTSPVVWPTIEEITRYLWQGSAPNDLSTANDNATIEYRLGDGTYLPITPPPTQLTEAEFARSSFVTPGGTRQRTIRIKARSANTSKNLFYLTNIQMAEEDVLILDLGEQGVEPQAIYILLNNSSLVQPMRVTNIAYFYSTRTNPSITDPHPSYFWLNNTNARLEFGPVITPNAEEPIDKEPGVDPPTWEYRLSPGIRGLAYGWNTLSTGENEAGDIRVFDRSEEKRLKVKVNSIVASHIELKGKVTVEKPELSVDDPLNPDRYILYYRILEGYRPASGPLSTTLPNPYTPYDYGRYSP